MYRQPQREQRWNTVQRDSSRPNPLYRSNSRASSVPVYSRDVTDQEGATQQFQTHPTQSSCTTELSTIITKGQNPSASNPSLVRPIPFVRPLDQSHVDAVMNTKLISLSNDAPGSDKMVNTSLRTPEHSTNGQLQQSSNAVVLLPPTETTRPRIGHKAAYNRTHSKSRSINRFAFSDTEGLGYGDSDYGSFTTNEEIKRRDDYGSYSRRRVLPYTDKSATNSLVRSVVRKRSSLDFMIPDEQLSADPMGNLSRTQLSNPVYDPSVVPVAVGGIVGDGANSHDSSTVGLIRPRATSINPYAKLPPQHFSKELKSSDVAPSRPIKQVKKISGEPQSILKNSKFRYSLPRMRSNAPSVTDVEFNDLLPDTQVFPLRNASSYNNMPDATDFKPVPNRRFEKPIKREPGVKLLSTQSDIESRETGEVEECENHTKRTVSPMRASSVPRESAMPTVHPMQLAQSRLDSSHLSAKPPIKSSGAARTVNDHSRPRASISDSNPWSKSPSRSPNVVRISLDLGSFSLPQPTTDPRIQPAQNTVIGTGVAPTPHQAHQSGFSRTVAPSNQHTPQNWDMTTKQVSIHSQSHKPADSNSAPKSPERKYNPYAKPYGSISSQHSFSMNGTCTPSTVRLINPGTRPIVVDSRSGDPNYRLAMGRSMGPLTAAGVSRTSRPGTAVSSGSNKSSPVRTSDHGLSKSSLMVDQTSSTDESKRVVSSDPGPKRKTAQVSFNLDQNQCVEFSHSDRSMSQAKRIHGYISSTGAAPGEGSSTGFPYRPIPSRAGGTRDVNQSGWKSRFGLKTPGTNLGSYDPTRATPNYPGRWTAATSGTTTWTSKTKQSPPLPPSRTTSTSGSSQVNTSDHSTPQLIFQPTSLKTIKHKPDHSTRKSLYRGGQESNIFSDIEFYDFDPHSKFDQSHFRQEIRHHLPIDMFHRMP